MGKRKGKRGTTKGAKVLQRCCNGAAKVLQRCCKGAADCTCLAYTHLQRLTEDGSCSRDQNSILSKQLLLGCSQHVQHALPYQPTVENLHCHRKRHSCTCVLSFVVICHFICWIKGKLVQLEVHADCLPPNCCRHVCMLCGVYAASTQCLPYACSLQLCRVLTCS